MAAQRERRPGPDARTEQGSHADAAISVAAEMLAELRPGEDVRIQPTSKLERDLGFDSLALMELRERLEEELGIQIPDEALERAETLNDLLEAAGAEPAAEPAPRPTGAVREAAAGVSAPIDAATLTDVLDWYTDRHPDRLHIRLVGEQGSEGELSFADLRAGAERAAAGLQAAGVEPGQTVALMLPTSLEYFQVFFGAVLAGAVPVPIYPPARPSQLEDHVRRHAAILRNAEARVLATVPEARSVARLLRAQVPSLGTVATPTDLMHADSPPTLVRPSADDLAMLQYTSGSTATPKGVELTHANLLANIRTMADLAEVDPASDVFVSWLPLYHDMGLIGAWFGSLVCGMPLVVMSPLTFLSRPVRWLRTIHEYKGTISAAPNFAYELCCTRIRDSELEGVDLSSWRLALNGAEPISPDTLERFRDRYRPYGLRPEAIFPVYGLAESAVGLTFPPPGREPRVDRVSREAFGREGRAEPAPEGDPNPLRVVGCGRPLPGHEIRIADDRGRDLGERKQGRICFRGPSATRGYHRNPEDTERLFDGDWLDSGDLGYLADGELFVTGRIKDLIIRGGRNLHPQEIEDAVGAMDGIRRGCVAAFAAADATSGTEKLVVVAETREKDSETRSRLRDEVRATVSDVAGLPPDEVVLAPPRAVLKTSSGKIRRAATRERWEADELHKPAAKVWRQALRTGVIGVRPQVGRAVRTTRRGAFGVLAWVATVLVAIPGFVLLAVVPGRRVRWRVANGALRLLMRVIRTPLSVTGAERIPDGPCVVVSPHGSPLDGVALVAAVRKPLTFVVLQSIAEVPIVGWLLRRMGVEWIDREDRGKAVSGTERLTEAARRGARLVVFPESTMSRVRGLRSFRNGAFVIAARAGVPVVPVGIEGTREMVGPRGRFPSPGHVRVVVGEPISPRGDDWSSAVELRDAARTELLRLLDLPDLAR